MSTTQLPRRPFVQLSPPDGGLDDVRRTARGRRRRRAIAVAALGSGVATTATVLALLGGSGDLAVLKSNVVPPAGGQTSPGVSRVTGAVTPPAQTQAAGHAAVAPAGAGTPQTGAGTQQSSVIVGGGTAAGNGTSHGSSTSSSNSPQMSRYRSTQSKPAVCEAVNGDSNNSFYGTYDWCLYAKVTGAADGPRLTFSLCRATTSNGTLTFGTTNEADISVQRNGKTVWDWARAHPARSAQHTLSLGKNECWNWSLVWPDVTQSGASAGSGSFTFVARTYAEELVHNATVTQDFSI
jgi:hypothetical protein